MMTLYSAAGLSMSESRPKGEHLSHLSDIVTDFMKVEYYEDFVDLSMPIEDKLSLQVITDIIPNVCNPDPTKRFSARQLLDLPLVRRYISILGMSDQDSVSTMMPQQSLPIRITGRSVV
eukprot:GHVQ01033012.1.p3 GENE.GHVQ01033012.1~~GHVQ01033012.1.p3  ORF type:complete len:119 (-),score=10.17 GHVQ01033012.1:1002-1358(-)